MCCYKKGIRSFTIIELVTVMAIGSVVILLLMLFFQKVWMSMHKISSETGRSNKEYIFLNHMQRDINDADVVRWENDILELYKNDTLHNVYLFDKSHVIYQSDIFTDTLQLEINRVDTSSIYSPYSGNYVTGLNIQAIKSNEECSFLLTKNYSRQTLYQIKNKLK